MNVDNIMLSELRQTAKDWYYMSFHYMECKKKKKRNSLVPEGRMVVIWGWKVGKMARCWSKATDFEL